jgi:hypothetical protein
MLVVRPFFFLGVAVSPVDLVGFNVARAGYGNTSTLKQGTTEIPMPRSSHAFFAVNALTHARRLHSLLSPLSLHYAYCPHAFLPPSSS